MSDKSYFHIHFESYSRVALNRMANQEKTSNGFNAIDFDTIFLLITFILSHTYVYKTL